MIIRNYNENVVDETAKIKTMWLSMLVPRVPSPCGHSCMVCATVCLIVMPWFSDITDVSTIRHSFKTDRSRAQLFHVAQYGDDIIGRELNLR